MNKSGRQSGARGAVLVELALIVPVLLLILFGLIELGRGLYQQHILTKAVEVGARYMGREPNLLIIDEASESCTPREPTWTQTVASARNLVVYGSANGGTAPLLSNLEVANVSASVRWQGVDSVATDELVGHPCVLRIEASAAFDPVIAPEAFLGLGELTLRASAEERHIGE